MVTSAVLPRHQSGTMRDSCDSHRAWSHCQPAQQRVTPRQWHLGIAQARNAARWVYKRDELNPSILDFPPTASPALNISNKIFWEEGALLQQGVPPPPTYKWQNQDKKIPALLSLAGGEEDEAGCKLPPHFHHPGIAHNPA